MLKTTAESNAIRVNSDGQKKKGALGRFAKSVKNSPKFVRKAFGNVKKAMLVGKNVDHSTLKNCQANGWLYKDEDIHKGVNYKVKYLGSVEVDYDSKSTTNNQESAQKAMRALYAHHKNTNNDHGKMALSLSVDRICLTDLGGSKTVMRHSTTRIAYSTVDTQKPKVFAYVAVVKNTQLALCHVFACKNPKQGYEMTFVCAQAFDMNYRRWREDSNTAKEIASKTEQTDVEPSQAWQKKKDELKAAQETNTTNGTKQEQPKEAPAKAPSPLPPGKKVFLAIKEGQDPADLAENYFKSLGISMIEDEDDFGCFTDQILRSESDPWQLQLGVDPEAYNATSADSGGYMTVGNFEFNNDHDDDSDDDEL